MDPLSGFGSTNPNIVRDRQQAVPLPPQASTAAQLANSADAIGFDRNKFEVLQKDIRAAVDSALKESDGSGSVRDSVQTAIGDVLRKHGIDPSTLRGPQLGQLATGGRNPFAGFSTEQIEADALDMLFSSLTDSEDEEVRSVLGDTLGRLPAGSLFDGQA